MIQIHHARPSEQGAAEALWTDVFEDGPEFQREFYRLCAPNGPLVLLEDGELRAMLALPELPLILADGRTLRAGYVYALACRPDRRGNGYASMLLETAAGLAGHRGLDCLLTVPAQPSLFQFFARNRFQPGFYCRQETFSPQSAPAAAVAPEEYAALREELLAGLAHTAYTLSQLAFQQAMCPHPGSGLYRLELPHGPGCAAVENWPSSHWLSSHWLSGPVVKELLCAPGDREAGGAAAAALCAAPTEVRTPAGQGEGKPFAAIRWLEGTPASIRSAALDGWLGLAFD